MSNCRVESRPDLRTSSFWCNGGRTRFKAVQAGQEPVQWWKDALQGCASRAGAGAMVEGRTSGLCRQGRSRCNGGRTRSRAVQVGQELVQRWKEALQGCAGRAGAGAMVEGRASGLCRQGRSRCNPEAARRKLRHACTQWAQNLASAPLQHTWFLHPSSTLDLCDTPAHLTSVTLQQAEASVLYYELVRANLQQVQ